MPPQNEWYHLATAAKENRHYRVLFNKWIHPPVLNGITMVAENQPEWARLVGEFIRHRSGNMINITFSLVPLPSYLNLDLYGWTLQCWPTIPFGSRHLIWVGMEGMFFNRVPHPFNPQLMVNQLPLTGSISL